MAKTKAPAQVSHHEAMGHAAASAMRHLGATGMQQAIGDPSNFANIPAQHQDFTPRDYVPKREPQG